MEFPSFFVVVIVLLLADDFACMRFSFGGVVGGLCCFIFYTCFNILYPFLFALYDVSLPSLCLQILFDLVTLGFSGYFREH